MSFGALVQVINQGMKIRQLQYFVGIVEAGSISRAAQALHVAQPALSLQMNRLEEEVGVKLLDRGAHGATPTEAGAAVYRHAKQVLRQFEGTAAVAAQANSGPSGPVVVGLPWTVASIIGLDLLRRVLAEYPAVQLQIIEGTSTLLGGAAEQGRLDMAIVFDNSANAALALKPLAAEPLWLLGARGTLAGRRQLDLAQAAEFPLLLLGRPNGVREQLEKAWSEIGVKPNIRAEINSPGLLLEAISEGMGYSILPSASLPGKGSRLKLDRVALEGGKLMRTAYLAIPRQFITTSAMECVADIIVSCVQKSVRDGRWKAELFDSMIG